MEGKKENVILDKSFAYAVRIIRLSQYLVENKKEFILSKQLIRSGTSPGAVIRESQNAESKADFVHKLRIAQKECDESIYWLELLNATDYLNKKEFESMRSDATELLKIIKSVIITTKKGLKNNS